MKHIKKYESKTFYQNRPEFHHSVENGDVVKLDRDYIESLDKIDWDGNSHYDSFSEEDYSKEYYLINYDWDYGFALRKTKEVSHNFLGWVPPMYVRHLTEEEMLDYKERMKVYDDAKKYNL